MKNNKTNKDSKWPYTYKRYLQYCKHTDKYININQEEKKRKEAHTKPFIQNLPP